MTPEKTRATPRIFGQTGQGNQDSCPHQNAQSFLPKVAVKLQEKQTQECDKKRFRPGHDGTLKQWNRNQYRGRTEQRQSKGLGGFPKPLARNEQDEPKSDAIQQSRSIGRIKPPEIQNRQQGRVKLGLLVIHASVIGVSLRGQQTLGNTDIDQGIESDSHSEPEGQKQYGQAAQQSHDQQDPVGIARVAQTRLLPPGAFLPHSTGGDPLGSFPAQKLFPKKSTRTDSNRDKRMETIWAKLRNR